MKGRWGGKIKTGRRIDGLKRSIFLLNVTIWYWKNSLLRKASDLPLMSVQIFRWHLWDLLYIEMSTKSWTYPTPWSTIKHGISTRLPMSLTSVWSQQNQDRSESSSFLRQNSKLWAGFLPSSVLRRAVNEYTRSALTSTEEESNVCLPFLKLNVSWKFFANPLCIWLLDTFVELGASSFHYKLNSCLF